MSSKNPKFSLFIVGAGQAQVKAIQMAKQMGCRVISVDGDPKAPGAGYSDEHHVCDVKDVKTIVELAMKFGAHAAMSISSDICLPAVAAVNQAVSARNESSDDMSFFLHKGKTRKRYVEHEVPGPLFYVLNNEKQLKKASSTIGYPSVIKPVDRSGSKGVRFVDSPESLTEAYGAAHKESYQGEVILEEYMPGTEVAIEAYVIDSEIYVLTLSDKERTEPPYLLDTAVIFPSKLPQDLQEDVKIIVRRAVKALGVTNGPIHAEVMITDQGPKLVEIAVRGAGFKVYTDILPHVTGVDPVEMQIKSLMGEVVEPKIHDQLKGAVLKFWGGKEGIIQSVRGVEKARSMPGIVDLQIYHKKGDRVRSLTSGADRLGHLIAFAQTRDEAVEAANAAYEHVQIEIKTK